MDYKQIQEKMRTLSEKQSVFTFNIHRLIKQAYKLGFELQFGEAYRTHEQQNELSVGNVKWSHDRAHMLRLAVDFGIIKDDLKLFQSPFEYDQHLILCKPLSDYWLSLNTLNEWGGNFKEDDFSPEHFEMKD